MRHPAMMVGVAVLLLLCAGCGGKGPETSKKPAETGKSAETPAPAPAPASAPVKITGWRNDGSGHFDDATPPVKWDSDEKQGVLWRVKVGSGQSSPVVVGERVFVTTEMDWLRCVDRKTGRVLWEKDNGFASLPAELKMEEKRQPADPGCGFSTPTPVTDGTHVYTSYGTGIVVCYDLAGGRKWVRYFDVPQMTQYGRSASCVLVDGKLIVSLSGVLALEAATGKTVWNAEDAEAAYYGTPVVVKIGGENTLVTPNGYVLRVADGKILAASIGLVGYNSPVVRDNVAYFASGTVSAVKLPDKATEGMKIRTLWEVDIEGELYSSPVWHEGLLYVVSNEGVLYAVDTEKGALAWKKEIPIPSAGGMAMQPANIYASLALAGGKLYLSNTSGHMLVLAPGREYKELSKNYIDEGSGASPVFDGKQLFLRGGEEMYCIQQQAVD